MTTVKSEGPRDPVTRGVQLLVKGLDARDRKRPLRAAGIQGKATFWHLQNARLFDRIPRETLERLSDESVLTSFSKRTLVTLDAGAGHVYVLTLGGAKLCRIGVSGRRMIEGVVSPGDLFGSISSVVDESYQLEPIEDTHVVAIPRPRFEALLTQQPDFTREVVQVLEGRERSLRRRVESLVFKDVPTRVAETLLELSRDYGESCTHGFAVDVRITQQDLADLVGASRQMVNRVLRDLTLRFYIKRKGKFLCILHLDRLQRLAEGLAEAGDER